MGCSSNKVGSVGIRLGLYNFGWFGRNKVSSVVIRLVLYIF